MVRGMGGNKAAAFSPPMFPGHVCVVTYRAGRSGDDAGAVHAGKAADVGNLLRSGD